MTSAFGSFALTVDPSGVADILFDRPPVNAVTLAVYEDLGRLVDALAADEGVRAVILAAPPGARAWCGGADLRDFVGMDPERRRERYGFINAQLPRFQRLDRPTIAAIDAPAIGIGMILAGLCDIRIAAEDALFACPEIDYGLVGGGGGLFSQLKMPEAKIREMLFTGRRFTARELEPTGFFNYVLPRSEVAACARELAEEIARKSLPAIRARKAASVALEGLGWMEAYLDAQSRSADLAGGRDGQEGVQAFLQGRPASYQDG